ncbi:hypothetical protein [Streptomyces fodineus]|uniref:hypothetical protein n=1 Tax=Streptomyces fodineus TaxID=1904616 RepID=UPI001D03B700|nr:hypothetical protein [Streptomyces fodineus]
MVGGSPAALSAPLKAARDGADVALADKGHCGTSSTTASAGIGVWYVTRSPPRGGGHVEWRTPGRIPGRPALRPRWCRRHPQPGHRGRRRLPLPPPQPEV